MSIIGNVKEEIRIIKERDPAIHSSLEVFLYPSFKVMLHYRIAHKLYCKRHYFLARWISQRAVRKTGIEIHPGATIGNNVMISAGAKVLGSFTIGDNSKIGAGSVVLSEVPPNSTVVGVPGRVVRRNNLALPQESMNQTDLPDPVKEEIANLQRTNAELSARLSALEQIIGHKEEQ